MITLCAEELPGLGRAVRDLLRLQFLRKHLHATRRALEP
jgi:hypothetical protein